MESITFSGFAINAFTWIVNLIWSSSAEVHASRELYPFKIKYRISKGKFVCDIGSRSKGYQAIPDTISERDDLPNCKIGMWLVKSHQYIWLHVRRTAKTNHVNFRCF